MSRHADGGSKGWRFGSGAGGYVWPHDTPVDRDVLPLPELMLESLDQDRVELAHHLRPIFAVAWNAER